MRIIVLTCMRQGSASLCLPELLASPGIDVAGVVLAQQPGPSRMRRARRLLRKVARIGPLGALNGVRLRGWYRGDDTEAIDEICARHGVPFHLVPSVNSVETEAHFRSAEADLGVSLGNSYIAARIFEIPKRGMINLHGEILPDYRGGQSVIWPIYEGHTETGFTIHQIDASIDGGAILYQRRVPIEFRPALRDTVRKSQPASSEIAAAVRMVCEDHERLAKDARPQGPGTSYTTPTFRQYLRMVRNNRRLYQFSRARAAEMDPEPSVRDSIRGTGDR